MNRYKPIGWRYESAKHALAAQGIKSKYDYREKWMDKLHTNQSHPEVKRHASEERLKDLSETEHSFKAKKVCLSCNTEYNLPVYMKIVPGRTPRCPNCGFQGSIDSSTEADTGNLPTAKFARKDYPNLFVSDEVPEIPAQGKTIEEMETELAAKARADEKELHDLEIRHPIAYIKSISEAHDKSIKKEQREEEKAKVDESIARIHAIVRQKEAEQKEDKLLVKGAEKSDMSVPEYKKAIDTEMKFPGEQAADEAELARLQRQYDELRAAHHYDSPKTIGVLAKNSAKEEYEESKAIVSGGDSKDIEKVTEATPWMSKAQKHDEKLMLKLLSSYN